MYKFKSLVLVLCIGVLAHYSAFSKPKAKAKTEVSSEKKEKLPFSFEEVMKFKALRTASISADGKFAAYSAIPDRGDAEAFFVSTSDSTKYSIKRGERPVISKNSKWGAVSLAPKAVEIDNAKSGKDKPKSGMSLIDLSNGAVKEFQTVTKFEFSNDSKWLAYQLAKDDKASGGDDKKNKDKQVGTTLMLRHLNTGTEIRIDNAVEYLFDSTSNYIFYSISTKSGEKDGIYYRDLTAEFAPEFTVKSGDNKRFSNLTWNKAGKTLAFLFAALKDNGKAKDCDVYVFDPAKKKADSIFSSTEVTGDWFIPDVNGLKWSQDGKRLFFGVKPTSQRLPDDKENTKYTKDNYFDSDTILQRNSCLIWHWNDPLIVTNQKSQWNKEKDRFFYGVYNTATNKFIQLADTMITDLEVTDNPDFALLATSVPYLKERTWYGDYEDLYVVSLADGKKTLVEKRLEEQTYISPDGKYTIYYKDKQWYKFENATGAKVCLTDKVNRPFYDEDHDVPSNVPSKGFAGWVNNGKAALIYEKYDIWSFDCATGAATNITKGAGLASGYAYRIKNLDREKKFFTEKDELILISYNHKNKNIAVFTSGITPAEPKLVFDGPKRFNVLFKSEFSDKVIMTRESFEEFPDLMATNTKLEAPKKITEVNPELKDYRWGTTELVRWKNGRGEDLDGYIMKPDNFDPAKKYPVLVYFYDRMSDRTYYFTQPVLTHRPVYQIYLSEGYIVFCPDIKYKAGNPGFDATDAIMKGCRKLVEMGIADSNKFCIQGHSWGGYQAAFIITQTNFFKAAGAGAPVGNMTSAYSQIRLESGLSRQFQYEAQQSRIGGNLWDSLSCYIRNSPVFAAQTMNTPFLIYFGDIDEAVPWPQGIELYMALRRLGKPAIMLQYMDEPHWPGRYQNKLDYSIKMKEFFDHYVLGTPAPTWITDGKPYRGE